MAILKIARMGHPVLLAKAEPVTDPGAPEIRRLVADMIETMEDAQGAGLAAPQVHVPLRLFVFRVPPGRTQPAEGDGEMGNTVVINPELELLGEEMVMRWEGCLSIPGLARRRAAAPARSLSRRGHGWAAGWRRCQRLPCRRGAARIRSSRRDPLPDAHA